MHAPVDGSEIVALERVALEDAGVQAEIAKMKLPEGAVVVCDPWIYGKMPLLQYRMTSDNSKVPMV